MIALTLLGCVVCGLAAQGGDALAVDQINHRQRRPRLEKVSLQLKWRHSFQFAGYYAAVHQGFYHEEGLDVELREAPPGVSSIGLVLQGAATYGVGSTDVLRYRAKGMPIVVLAAIFQQTPRVLLIRADVAIDTAEALRNRRIMALRDDFHFVIDPILRQVGLNPEDLHFVPHTGSLNDFVDGNVDAMGAYLTNQPFDLDRLGFAYRVFRPSDYGLNYYDDCLFTLETELTRHPERVAAFRRASLRGWEYAMRYPAEIIDLILAHYAPDHSREKLAFQARTMRPLMGLDKVAVGYMHAGRWRMIGKDLVAHGLINEAELERLPFSRFVYEAGFDPQYRRWMQLSGWILAAVLWLCAVIVLMNFRLRHLVAKRTADLSARHQAFRGLFRNALSAVVIFDVITDDQGEIVDFEVATANPAVKYHTGLAPSELLGKRLTALRPEITQSELFRLYRDVVLQGDARSLPYYSNWLRRHFHIQVYRLDSGKVAISFVDDTESFWAQALTQAQLKIFQALESASTIEGLLRAAAKPLQQLPLVDAGALYLSDPALAGYRMVADWGLSPAFRRSLAVIEWDSPHGRHIADGREWIRQLVGGTSVESPHDALNQAEGLRAVAVFPLCWGREVQGSLHLGLRRNETFPETLVTGLSTIARQLANAIVRLNAEAWISRERLNLETIFQKIPVMIVVANRERRVLFANAATLRNLGLRLTEIRQMKVEQLHPERLRAQVVATFETLLSHPLEACAFPLLTRDGTEIPVEIRVADGFWDGKDVMIASMHDMRERERMVASLRASEANFRAMAQASLDGVVITDAAGNIRFANQRFLKMVGADTQRLSESQIDRWLGQAGLQGLHRRMRNPEAFDLAQLTEMMLIDVRQKSIPVDVSVARVRWEQQPAHMFEIRDLTWTKRLQADVLGAVALEKQNIGRELHDGVAQDIAAAAYMLQGLLAAKRGDMTQTQTAMLNEIKTLLQDGLVKVRGLARGIYGQTISTENWLEALRTLRGRTEEIFGITCRLYVPQGGVRVKDAVMAMHLYYIVQESVMNAVRHGQPKTVSICFECDAAGGFCRLWVEDDGRGFDLNAEPDAGLGLRLLQYRADMLGAILKIDSVRGHGTRIHCEVNDVR